MKLHDIPIEVTMEPYMRRWLMTSRANLDAAVDLIGGMPSLARFCGVSEWLAEMCRRIVKDNAIPDRQGWLEISLRATHEWKAIAELASSTGGRAADDPRDFKY